MPYKETNCYLGRCDRCGRLVTKWDVAEMGDDLEVKSCLYCRGRDDFPDLSQLDRCPSSPGSY